MLKPGEEDLADQQARLTSARQDLSEMLAAIESEAKTLKKRFANNRDADLSDFFALTNAVRRCEEAYDLARYDLGTAGGEDG